MAVFEPRLRLARRRMTARVRRHGHAASLYTFVEVIASTIAKETSFVKSIAAAALDPMQIVEVLTSGQKVPRGEYRVGDSCFAFLMTRHGFDRVSGVNESTSARMTSDNCTFDRPLPCGS